MPAAPVEVDVPPLVAGDKLTRDEFLRRWEAMPGVKFAELIGGIVYMPSPLSLRHGSGDNKINTWLGVYAASTPGCEAVTNATCFMEDDAPQPDGHLRLLPAYGGQSREEGEYLAGAPELAAEICLSSTAYDLHQKLELYQTAGVLEYVAVLLRQREVRWHRRRGEEFSVLPAPAEGVYRSEVFPGLWLDAPALLAGDMARVLAVLAQGTASPEHAAFVTRLRGRAS